MTDDDIVELSLLLPHTLAEALCAAARQNQCTTGSYLRRLIRQELLAQTLRAAATSPTTHSYQNGSGASAWMAEQEP